MEETKRQHYVPRTYLQKFAEKRKKNYLINAADKNDLSKIIFPNITNVCLETDLYTLKGQTKEERQALEAFYSDSVESIYNEVYQVLADDTILQISEDLHYKIVMTIITMLYRTSKWLHTHNDFFDTVLEKGYSLCKQMNQDSIRIENIEYSIKGKSLETVQREFRDKNKEMQVLTQLEVALKLINIRKFDGILVSKLSPDNQLITSDNPVILTNIALGRIVPFDPENMIGLPLDSRYLLTIMPHSQSDGSHKITRLNHVGSISFAKMVSNNSAQFSSSYKYILGSKRGLSEFVANKELYEKPVTEEQKKSIIEITERINELLKNFNIASE